MIKAANFFVDHKNKIVKSIQLLGAAVLFIFIGSTIFIEATGVFVEYASVAFKYMYFILLDILIAYCCIKFDSNYRAFCKEYKKESILYSAFYTMSILSLFNPLSSIRTAVTSFTREIGMGYIYGVDCNAAISNFNQCFVLCVVCFVILTLFFNNILVNTKDEEAKKVLEYMNSLIIIADITAVYKCISYYNDNEIGVTFSLTLSILSLLLASGFIYVIFHFNRIVSSEGFLKLMICSCVLVIPVIIILNEKNIDKSIIVFQTIFTGIVLLFIALTKNRKNRIWDSEFFSVAAISVSFTPLLTSIYIETVNVLNQYSIFITDLRTNYAVIMAVYVIIAVIVGVAVALKKIKITHWKDISYFLLVLGIGSIYVQIPLQKEYSVDIFESANYSVLVSDFFNFGAIPIVDHLGHHMMEGVWEGILYGIVNNDTYGAIFIPYDVLLYIALLAVLYLFFSIVWNKDAALLSVLFIPMSYFFRFSYGWLVCFVTLLFIKKPSWFMAVCTWLSMIWCILYRGDVGLSFSVGACIALIVYVIISKNKTAFRQLAVSIITIGLIGCCAWFGICICKGINPIKRLYEFFMLFSANITWAYLSRGDTSLLAFSLCYAIIPIITGILLFYVIFSKKFRESSEETSRYLLIIFGVCYFINFPRGIVRHSLDERTTMFTIWTAYLFIALFISTIKNKKQLFLTITMAFVTFNNLLLSSYIAPVVNVSEIAVSKLEEFSDNWGGYEYDSENYWQKIKNAGEVVPRTICKEEVRDVINTFEIMNNQLLDEDDTFIDFVFSSFLYSALGRRDPVYAAQSPTMISKELSQEYFIEEVKSDINNIPFALLPYDGYHSTMDGIDLNIKYYKISEFIYENYSPLFVNGSFAVWCLNDRYDEMKNKLRDSIFDEKIGSFIDTTIEKIDCDIETNKQDSNIKILSYGDDPKLRDIQDLLSYREFIGDSMTILIECECDVKDYWQLFYTTEADEVYSESKSIISMESDNIVMFTIPEITENTKIRLDFPPFANVLIKSIGVSSNEYQLINYGYDGPVKSGAEYIYSAAHRYYTFGLPLYWAELDKKNAINNTVLAEAQLDGDVYVFDEEIASISNYVALSIEYNGNEPCEASIKLGEYADDVFDEKFTYYYTLQPGQHQYLFRVSSDYYWHSSDVNAVILNNPENTGNFTIHVLEGD